MKKLLALMLSVAMIFTMSTGVMAYSDIEEGTYVSEAVTVLSNLGILNGYEDDSFKPEATVTRAETAKIICETLGYDHISSNNTPFDDVESTHWAAGYINTAYGLGIINGYGDGKFGPEDTVTYEQAVKMIVCALGYEPMAIEKGGWPAGYTSVATSIGLTEGVNSSARGDIAVLVYNALHTPIMERTSYGSDVRYEILDGSGYKEYKTILTEQDIYIATGIIGEKYNKEEIAFEITKDSEDQEFYAVNPNERFIIGNSDIEDYIHQEVEAYVIEDDGEYTVLSVQIAKATETFTLVSDDIKSINGNKITYYSDSLTSSKTKTLTVDEEATIEYNKADKTDTSIAGASNIDILTTDNNGDRIEDIEITFIENDNDNSYDVAVMTMYTSERLEMVDPDRDKMILNGKTVLFDFDDEDKTYIFVDDEGNDLTLTDFAEDDVVAYIADNSDVRQADYIKIIKLSNSVISGKIETVNTNDRIISIDDEDYEVATVIWDENTFTPGTEGTFYVGITGKIVYYDDTTIKSNYGYILASGVNTDGFEDEVVLKMLTTNGVDKYYLTDKAETIYVDKVGNDGVVAWNEGTIIKAESFVEYKVNRKGLISSLKWNIDDMDNFKVDDTYNADTEILNGYFIDTNTQVFVLNEEDEEKTYVTDMDYFVDEGTYIGAAYVKNGDTEVVFIQDSDTTYNSEKGFAIVTGTSHMVDEDKNEIFAVDYVQNEIEDTIYFEEGDVTESDFSAGTVFVFNISDNNFVNKYKIIASVDNYAFVEGEVNNIGKDVTVVFGTIDNISRKTNSRGELITVNDNTYVITSKANKYTFDNTRYKNRIEIEDFLSGNAYYGNNTPVMLKLVDGVVVDIYTISPKDAD